MFFITEGWSMPLLIAVLGDIIHLAKIILICSLFFKFNRRNGRYQQIRISVVALAMIVISVCINKSNNEILNTIIYAISIIILICSLYKEKISRIIPFSIWIIFIVSILDIMSQLLIDSICIISKLDFKGFDKLYASILSLVFVLFFGLFYNKKSNISIKNANVGSLIVFSLVAVADAVIVILMANFIEEQFIDNIVLVLMFCMVVLGMFFQLAIVIVLFVQKNLYMEEKQLTEKYLNKQKNHYEYLEIREKETKKFRHDLTSHMQTLSTLIRDKNFTEVDKYFAQINEKIENLGNLITVHNGIVDAIINQYYSMAQQKNIDMKVTGRFPVNCGIDAYDLCTVFSNILSNAIESAEEADVKKIFLSCRYMDNKIIVVAKNTFKDIGQFTDGRPKTSKKDVNYHGFGLENISDCVNKNNGMFNIEIEDNEFIITILLNYEDVENDKNCNH